MLHFEGRPHGSANGTVAQRDTRPVDTPRAPTAPASLRLPAREGVPDDAYAPAEHAPAPTAPTARSDVALLTHIDSERSMHVARAHSNGSTVLLSTAQVVTYDTSHNRHIIRVLLDSASQGHFITKECCDKLGLDLQNTESTIIKGFGGSEKLIKTNYIDFKFYSRFNDNIFFNISPLVVDQITDLLPTAVVDTSVLSHLTTLPLADDSYGTPGKIDALIGASLFSHLLLPDAVRTSRDPSTPLALNTVLGYVIMGSAPTLPTLHTHQVLTCCTAQTHTALDSLVKKFWELEQPPSASNLQHPAHIECEEYYKSTTTRDPDSGRYVVALPFNEDVYTLGDSYVTARRRFLCLERKLESSPQLRSAYDDVIKDYLDKCYISPAPQYDSRDPTPFYVIPHHGVIREEKTSTRLRIVLDASSKTSTGRSLNDILHSGPNLQGDLFKIILNFRLYAIAMTADCRQQFLQIIIREADRRYQCFLYRFKPQDPLMLYQFNRVCFGLSSSPYHALRTVRQLLIDDGARFPLASSIVPTSLYMDDIAFSVPSESEAVSASEQLIDLFKGAQWDLVKWNSNCRHVLNNIPGSHKLPDDVEFDKSAHNKILGLHWSTDSDSFYFKISTPADGPYTKRSILSTIARLWDIMGFVAPTVVYAKLILKQLWQLHLDWDDIPPPHIGKMWKQFCAELPVLNTLRIPRHVGVCSDCSVSVIGFCDASELAYGAVLYLHVNTARCNSVRLVCAKSKLAPTKPLSIARLELCGAVLLSKLLRIVIDIYSQHFSIKTYAFTDSKVALYWIKSSPHRWQTFVANRVVQVTDNVSADDFYHVSGIENPADILSRGITPQKLITHPLWLHGPQWLSLDRSQWPLRTLDDQIITDIPEQKTVSYAVYNTPAKHCVLYNLACRTSSWSKLLRIVVYLFRFAKLSPRSSTIAVTADDLLFAENRLLRALQSQHFVEEYSNIVNNKPCSRAFNRLRPFIDDGLIRVGGRLVNSALDYSHIHPVILPRSDPVVNMVIDFYHIKYLHAGPELLMSLLRQKFWILSARRIVGQQLLSYEELCTVLAQIECLLNSRPLTVQSSDPAEPAALTPSHFLHTAPLFSLPAPELKSEPVSLLNRHSLLDKLVQSFWNRWRMEYLHGLQVRQKWNTHSNPITPGTLVIILDDNAPPLTWPLAIVEKVHPSKDGIIRVATVRTVKGIYLRPIVRLCPLPSQ